MRAPRYSLPALRRHTRSVRTDGASLIQQHQRLLDAAVRRFDEFFARLDEESDNLQKNVRKLLATSFFNHWYSALLLIESGLIVDGVLCARNAMETLAFHWLVCVDSAAADGYHSGRIPKPVEVRRRLEVPGVDVSHIRDRHAAGSEISHGGRQSERFHLEWQAADRGQLMIGGTFWREDLEHWLEYLPVLLQLFPEPILVMKASERPGA